MPVEPAVLGLLSLPADFLCVCVWGGCFALDGIFFFPTLLKNKFQSATKVGISLPLVGC